jgi:phosphate-selective porin
MSRTRAFAVSALSLCAILRAQEPPRNPGGQQSGRPTAAEIDAAIARYFAENAQESTAAKVSYGEKGFRLESADGNFETNLQWRAQLRFTDPYRSDPRQVDDFEGTDQSTFEGRRLRMKIGGHGFRPWLKYYFEVDLQPTRSSSNSSANASSRVIDWRIDVAQNKAFGIRAGQWKIDYNRERVDSSGRQQFVERSIVNRIFTVDRQMGVGIRGRLFDGTAADLRYYAGAFTGEGRGVSNDDRHLMYVTRLQWNFLGRDLPLRQTDVERTEKPTASFAIGGATHTGRPTRWSSGGGGNLDGFDSVSSAANGQHRIYQAVAEFAYKHQGFSTQNEFHWKSITDKSMMIGAPGRESDLYGLYTQFGYFFNEVWPSFPEELELACRYAWLREPNEGLRTVDNERQEFTVGANWFFSGHNNKITLDYSYLTLDDDVMGIDKSASRVRLQWDISF